MIKLIFAIFLFLYSQPSFAATSLTPQEKFDLGQKYLKRGNYPKALEQFNQIRNFYRDDPLAIEAELAIADLYFKKNEWDQARVYYDEFERRFPNHPKIDYVSFQLGLCYYKKAPKTHQRDQRWTEQAIYHWRDFETKYPKSTYREEVAKKFSECRNRLAEKELYIAKFYQNRSAWEAVKRRTDFLIKNHPESDVLSEAYELSAISNFNLGKSEESEKALNKLKELKPQKAGEIKADLTPKESPKEK